MILSELGPLDVVWAVTAGMGGGRVGATLGGGLLHRTWNDMPDVVLDDVVATPPTVLVVDVEGSEAQVIEDARRLLTEPRPLLWVRINPAAMLAHGHLASDLHRLLASFGYVPEVAEEDAEHGDLFRWYHPEGRRP